MSLIDESALRALIGDEVRKALREERAAALPGSAAHDGYLSVREAARIASVAPDTIRAWVGAGRLGRYKAGRVLRVKRSELERLLAAPQVCDESPEAAARRFLARRAARPRAA